MGGQLLGDSVLVDGTKVDVGPVERNVSHDVHAALVREKSDVAGEQLHPLGLRGHLKWVSRLVHVVHGKCRVRVDKPHEVVSIAVDMRVTVDVQCLEALVLAINPCRLSHREKDRDLWGD